MTDPIRCERCGQPHPRCSAHNQAGKPCGQFPRTGATVCKRHGGHAPQVVAAAERRRKVAAAEQAADTYGLPRDVPADVALVEEMHRAAGHVSWLGALIAGLDVDGLTQWGESGRQASVWLDLYHRERKQLHLVAKDIVGLKLAEREVQVAEQQGAMLAAVIGRVLDSLDLTAEQRALVGEVVPRELRAVVAGGGE